MLGIQNAPNGHKEEKDSLNSYKTEMRIKEKGFRLLQISIKETMQKNIHICCENGDCRYGFLN